MAIEKVKLLKIEPLEGDQFPTESDASEDYASLKGVAFEGLDTFLAEKVGGVLRFQIPDCSLKPAFLANGEIDYVEAFNGPTQTTPNRIYRVDLAYDGSLNPTSETWKFYSPTDGTTILQTVTVTHTWTGFDLTKSTEVTT